MQSTQFEKYFNFFPYLKKYYVGTFAIDKIPLNLKQHHFFVFNSDTSDQSGQHWLCCYKEDKIIYCFDSIGIDEQKKQMLESFFKHFKGVKEIHFNETQFQTSTSATCGQFTIYFLVQKSFNKDLSFQELLEEIFQKDSTKNELLVKHFFDKVFEIDYNI